jgi:hypothetical protein
VKITHQPLGSCYIGKTSLFSRIIDAKAVSFIINHYLCDKSACIFKSANAFITRSVISRLSPVMKILRVIAGPKVAQPIISTDTVDMVNHSGEFAMNVKPSEPVSEIAFIVKADSDVAFSVHGASDSTHFGPISATNKVCKYTRLRAIVQDRFKVFLGKHGGNLGQVRYG